MKIEKVKAKQLVISSYSDLSKLSPNIESIHFRKFVSKKLLGKILKNCPSISKISLSASAAKRLKSCSFMISEIDIDISRRHRGRPNSIEVF